PSLPLPPLLSFPTRRSSDLERGFGRADRSFPEETSRFQRKRDQPVGREIYRRALHRGRREDSEPSIRRVGSLSRIEAPQEPTRADRKSTRLNSSHVKISYAV